MELPTSTIALAHRLDTEPIPLVIDPYARRGVWLTRDAGSRVIAALREQSFYLRERGGEPNLAAADVNDALARSINSALADS